MTQGLRALQPTDLFSDSWDYLNDSDEALQTQFSGSSAPTSPKAYQLWADTTAGQLKMRNSANDAWLVIGLLGANYLGLLPLSGGAMTGVLNMGGQQITNVGLGTGASAARQQELDLKASLAAPAFTGDATVNQDPAGNNSLVRRLWADGRYLLRQGGTMLGDLVLQNDADQDLEAVTLRQLRAFVGFSTSSGHRHDGGDSRKVRGQDIDSGAAADGLPLRSNGAGGAAFAKMPMAGVNCAFGSVAANGSVVNSGSGNWSVVRNSAGVYTITINGGVFTSAPAGLAASNDSDTGNPRHTIVLPTSSTSVQVKTVTFTGTLGDCPFSFLFV